MKVLLLDADCVIIKKDCDFSKKFAEEHNIPLDDISPFFTTELPKCQLGETDFPTALKPYLKKWNWKGSVADFMKNWFEIDFNIDAEVLSLVLEFQDIGVKCFLASNQEKNKAAFIREELKDYFDGFIFSCEVHRRMNDPMFFTSVMENTKISLRETVFFDDDQENVAAAQEMGVDACLYSSPADLSALLSRKPIQSR